MGLWMLQVWRWMLLWRGCEAWWLNMWIARRGIGSVGRGHLRVLPLRVLPLWMLAQWMMAQLWVPTLRLLPSLEPGSWVVPIAAIHSVSYQIARIAALCKVAKDYSQSAEPTEMDIVATCSPHSRHKPQPVKVG